MSLPRRKRVVVALGGNAAYPPTIRGTAEEQLELMREVCVHFVEIIKAGWQLVLTHGNGPVVVVPSATPGLPYGAGPGYGYGGAAVLPYGNGSGVVVTPGTAVPYGRYNKDAAREAFQINNALGGAQAANDAAARTQAPLTPLNPMPGGLR